MRCQLAPSVLNADFARIGPLLDMLREGGADWLHLDIMDGHFVPNITYGASVAADLIRHAALPAEAHLMVSNPESLIPGFAKAGCKRIIVHPEGQLHLHRLLQKIRELSVDAGVVINPATPICAIEDVLDMVGLVLVMTVNPGYGGQKFIPGALDKVRRLAALRDDRCLSYEIEVDGGVNLDTIDSCFQAGAGCFVVGSAICRAQEPDKALAAFVDRINSYGKI